MEAMRKKNIGNTFASKEVILMTHCVSYNFYVGPLVKSLKKLGYQIVPIGPFMRGQLWTQIKKLIRFRECRKIHIHWFPFNIETWVPIFILLKILRFRIFITAHNVSPHECRWWHPIAYSFFLRSASGIICHYQENKDRLQNVYQIKSTISVVGLPNLNYDYKKWDRRLSRKELGVDRNDQVVLYLGEIRPYKGVAVLIEAYKNFLTNKNIRLFIVGGSNYTKNQVKLESVQGAQFIRRRVRDEEIEKFIKAADILVFPFLQLSGSASLLLAYNFRVPFVATNVGGVPEEVSKYGGGITVEPNNPKKLAEAIWQCLNNPPAFTKERQLNWEAMGSACARIYKKSKG